MCHYFDKEIIKDGGELAGINCKAMSITFSSKAVQREFVYPLCASDEGFTDCIVYKSLQSTKKKETPQRNTSAEEEQWRSMSLKELSVELARMHKTYGEVQSMYYNHTLPEGFWKSKCEKCDS